MKRIEIIYDGQRYSVGGGDIDALRAKVESVQTAAEPTWLDVFSDEGRPQPAQLLLLPGLPIALIPVQD